MNTVKINKQLIILLAKTINMSYDIYNIGMTYRII